jgi:hypothetical protein
MHLSQASAEPETGDLPVFPLKREQVATYLASRTLGERAFFAGLHDRCLYACAWLALHPADQVSIGSDVALINGQCYQLSTWQREEIGRLDGAFAQGAIITKRQYLDVAEKRQPRKPRMHR